MVVRPATRSIPPPSWYGVNATAYFGDWNDVGGGGGVCPSGTIGVVLRCACCVSCGYDL